MRCKIRHKLIYSISNLVNSLLGIFSIKGPVRAVAALEHFLVYASIDAAKRLFLYLPFTLLDAAKIWCLSNKKTKIT